MTVGLTLCLFMASLIIDWTGCTCKGTTRNLIAQTKLHFCSYCSLRDPVMSSMHFQCDGGQKKFLVLLKNVFQS